MILVDTSVWVDHLRHKDEQLASLLEEGHVLMHPFVVGELAVGNLKQREVAISLFEALPQATVASHHEVMHFLRTETLHGRGIGYIDLHLLAASRLSRCKLWTRDSRLGTLAAELSLAAAAH